MLLQSIPALEQHKKKVVRDAIGRLNGAPLKSRLIEAIKRDGTTLSPAELDFLWKRIRTARNDAVHGKGGSPADVARDRDGAQPCRATPGTSNRCEASRACQLEGIPPPLDIPRPQGRPVVSLWSAFQRRSAGDLLGTTAHGMRGALP